MTDTDHGLTWKYDAMHSRWDAHTTHGDYRVVWSGSGYITTHNRSALARSGSVDSARTAAQNDYNKRSEAASAAPAVPPAPIDRDELIKAMVSTIEATKTRLDFMTWIFVASAIATVAELVDLDDAKIREVTGR